MIKYQNFKECMISLINQSELDVGMIYFILKDIFNEIELLYYKQLNRERQISIQYDNQQQNVEEE